MGDSLSGWNHSSATRPLAEGWGRTRHRPPAPDVARTPDVATLSAQRFHQLIHAENHPSRKCIRYATPAKLFIHQVLHLKCEPTFPPSRE